MLRNKGKTVIVIIVVALVLLVAYVSIPPQDVNGGKGLDLRPSL